MGPSQVLPLRTILWESEPSDKIKRDFFQTVVVSILLYACTTWTLTKSIEKSLDGNYTRIVCTVLNKSWKQHSQKTAAYLTNYSSWIKHVGYCGRSKEELISDVLLWIPHGRTSMGRPAKTYLYQLYTDKGCSLKDLPGAMNDGLREIESGNSVLSAWVDFIYLLEK